MEYKELYKEAGKIKIHCIKVSRKERKTKWFGGFIRNIIEDIRITRKFYRLSKKRA